MEESFQGGYDQNVLNTGRGCKGIKHIKKYLKQFLKASLLKTLQRCLKLARFTQDKDA